MVTVKNFFNCPEGILELAKNLDYSPKEYGGAHYPGFAFAPQGVAEGMVARLRSLHGKEIVNPLCTFRKGTDSNVLIHTDISVGTHTAIVYLCVGACTAFWVHNESGADRCLTYNEDHEMYLSGDGNDTSKWTLADLSGGGFNECSIYESNKFHSIYPYENMPNRLVAVIFYTVGE